jgi:periplasmic protein TonB
VPIASTDPVFIDAAMQSVKQWKYSPYLLNGEPTEIDTSITVNFGIR